MERTSRNGLRITKRLLLSIAAIGSAASIAGLGTFAVFTNTTSESHAVTTGTVVVGLGDLGTSANRLDIDATAVAPGDTIQRSVTLANDGTLDLASVTLTTSADPSSILDTDATDGLQMTIDQCDVAWTESGPPYTYTCSGTTTTTVASRAVIGTDLALSDLTLTAGATNHLRVTLTLPTTAGNTFQDLTSTISYAFTGTQRDGTDR